MSQNRSFILRGVVALALALPAWTQAQQAGAIKIQLPAPTVTTKRFDPKRHPPEMPKLNPPEAAVTVSAFACQAEVSVAVEEEQVRSGEANVRVRVEGIDFQGKLEITMWLPTNATTKIVRHEEGHRRISELYYAKGEPAVRAAAQRVIGRPYTGSGKTAQAAVKDAIGKAIGEVNDAFMKTTNFASEPVQAAFDRITRHGTNSVPEEEAIRRAVEEAEKKERRAGGGG